MKTLLIMRHAKAGWKDQPAVISDIQRPLTQRGQRDAPRMGQRLQDAGLVPQAILSSTSMRTRQTAAAVAAAIGFQGKVQFDAGLYMGEMSDYLAALHRVAARVQIAMLIGHGPEIDSLIKALTGQTHYLYPGSVAQIELLIGSWTGLDENTRARLKTIFTVANTAEN